MDMVVALIEALAKLAWPTIFFMVMFWFKGDIKDLLVRVKRAKILGNEFELLAERFSRDVEQTVQSVKSAPEERVLAPDDAATTQLSVETSEPRTPRRPFDFPRYAWDFLEEKIDSEPEIAIVLLSSEIEKALRIQLARRSINVNKYRGIANLARVAVTELGYPESFAKALERLGRIRNMIVNGDERKIGDQLNEVAASGYQLLRFIHTNQYQLVIIDKARMTVFLDQECTISDNRLEGLYLLYAAVPGTTGAHLYAATDQKGEYSEGMEVTGEWGKQADLPSAVWVQDDQRGALQIDLEETGVFRGRNIERLL